MYKFIKSSTAPSNWLNDHGKEVCFIGRSNVGKSSLINALTNQKRLARTSNTPGRTQLINFFQDNEGRTLVDLPGYGYAKMPKHQKEKMILMIEEYFLKRVQLRKAYILIDSKIGPTQDDLSMIELVRSQGIPYFLIITKVDKVNQSQIHKTKQALNKISSEYLTVSSFKGTNINKLKSIIKSDF
ncbi:MAG: YihA family ribosome biogenesis GTP-binding protein [Mycoplasmataceae bacterium]|nr:YihA family ribosome biogenesis GTP-binding protein [Mycoplasmataceae bacterium]